MNRYPVLRQVLAPEYAQLSPRQLEAAFSELFGESFFPEDAEGIFGSIGKAFGSAGQAIGNVAKAAAPIVTSALPGVLSGAMAGAALGPVGMIAGAALGGVGSALKSHGKGTAGTIGNVLSGATNIAGAVRGGGLGGLAKSGLGAGLSALTGQGGAVGNLAQTLGGALLKPGSGSGAAGQLLSLLGRPEVLQSLMALSLGPAGRQTVPGPRGLPIPTGAVAGLIRELADRAAQEAAEPGETYLQDFAGEYVVDPAIPEHRAALVLELLNEAEFARQARRVQAQTQGATRRAEAEAWEAETDDFEDLYADLDETDELDEFSGEDWEQEAWEQEEWVHGD